MIIKLQHPRRRLVSGELYVPSEPGDVSGIPLDTDRFYFELQAEGNHETIATSEIYNSRQAAEHAIALITSADMPHGWTLNDTTKAP